MRLFHSLPAIATAVIASLTGLSGPAAAQGNPFAPYVYVNEKAITYYELDQRTRMLTIFGTEGDVRQQASDQLIDDRLRVQAADLGKVKLSEQEIQGGIAEFAGRANMAPDQFMTALGQAGIAPETFRDFVIAGLSWRVVANGKFGEKVNISDADVDRALDQIDVEGNAPSGPRVLMSEIVVPIRDGNMERAQLLAGRIAAQATTAELFATLAEQYSTAGTGKEGGKLDWMAVSALPPEVRGAVAALKVGEVSRPLQIRENALTIYFMRDRREPIGRNYGAETLRYAQFLIPGGQSGEAQATAAKLRRSVDSCDDLYSHARGKPASQLTVETLRSSQIPADVARELARLDPGEISTALTRGGAMVFLMLCDRTNYTPDSGIPREQIRTQLKNQQLEALAQNYLEQLRTEATIRYP